MTMVITTDLVVSRLLMMERPLRLQGDQALALPGLQASRLLKMGAPSMPGRTCGLLVPLMKTRNGMVIGTRLKLPVAVETKKKMRSPKERRKEKES